MPLIADYTSDNTKKEMRPTMPRWNRDAPTLPYAYENYPDGSPCLDLDLPTDVYQEHECGTTPDGLTVYTYTPQGGEYVFRPFQHVPMTLDYIGHCLDRGGAWLRLQERGTTAEYLMTIADADAILRRGIPLVGLTGTFTAKKCGHLYSIALDQPEEH